MSEQVSSRHEGDAGGTLLPFGETKKRKVIISIAGGVAHLASAQHTAWMLTNLLCRSQGVVEQVGIICPAGVPMAGRVVPLASPGTDLLTALMEGGKEIGVVPITTSSVGDYTITIGLKPEAGAAFAAYGLGWCGGISPESIKAEELGAPSTLPYGPYVAACLAAGEVFKEARIREEDYSRPTSVFYSVWSHQVSQAPQAVGPAEITIATHALLAGVGAVGCAFLHALWSTSGVTGKLILADNDPAGLETTNLNRYALFGRASVGSQKATAAAALLSGLPISFDPHNTNANSLPTFPSRVVSAVDKNTARHAIQLKYPARILSASTYNLRAELLRCGPPGIGACLACYNPEETVMPDEKVREQLIKSPDEALESFALQQGVSIGEIRKSLESPQCGSLGERAISMLRPSHEQAAFAVGFVSVMAGTMLAAEFVKDHLPIADVLSEEKQRAVFQFLNPRALSNRPSRYLRDPNCPRCSPQSVACKIWTGRYNALRS
jgi:molybdopterin/thiamine biosynthesis adenylyltransferase